MKSQAIANLLEELAGRSTALETETCVRKPFGCGEPLTGFRDELSWREYKISGMCQKCQDDFYGPIGAEETTPQYFDSEIE